MQFAFGFALFVIGLALLSAGIGLLIGGEITFKSGKKIPLRAGRKAGIALVSFFPLVAVVLLIHRNTPLRELVPSEAFTWPLALTCLCLGGFWVWRGMYPRTSQPALTDSEPAAAPGVIVPEFDVPEESFPTPEAPAPQPPPTSRRRKDPFDFT